MNSERTDKLASESDDYLHEPDQRLKWRESYYFNWVDYNNLISGFSTLGILPNEKKREFVFILFIDNKREVYYREPDLSHYDKNDINSMLKDKKLTYTMIEPLKEWKIEYNSRTYKFNLTFKNRHQPYYFGKDSSASWHQHFESTGRINGSLILRKGKEIQLSGFGQRDKSWGYRDWHEFEKWYAGHFHFEDWSCGFRKDYIKGKAEVSGYLWNGEKNVSLKNVEVDVEYDNDAFNSPLITDYTLIATDGITYNVRAKRLTNTSFMRFARDFEDGYTELFEQMATMRDLDNNEVGAGMFEELRTHFS